MLSAKISWVRHIIVLAMLDILEMERSALVILDLFSYTLSISFGWEVTPFSLFARQLTFSKPPQYTIFAPQILDTSLLWECALLRGAFKKKKKTCVQKRGGLGKSVSCVGFKN